MKKLAIIGASSFQEPLIEKSKSMGVETHVFAWQCGDRGEVIADNFYPISITEKDAILKKCQELRVDGIATIASDLANITVAYVADKMGLFSNDVECVQRTTDKSLMRKTLRLNGDPSPLSLVYDDYTVSNRLSMHYPLIVKPSDRSGSRGITKINCQDELDASVRVARSISFSGTVLVEEFFEGDEYSVEYISWEGRHYFLALTEKHTTGAPNFIETAHLEPAPVPFDTLQMIRSVVEHALDGLGVSYGASHSEIKINEKGEIAIVEIGSRMGGDCIGSSLVELSTGYDYVGSVIQIALGEKPFLPKDNRSNFSQYAAVRFVLSRDDLSILANLENDDRCHVEYVSEMDAFKHHDVMDSSTRYGYFVYSSADEIAVREYLP